MATHASTYFSARNVPLFVRPATRAKGRGIPNWRRLDRITREDLLALLTQMIGHHVPRSRASDEMEVPDEPR
jgi:hypothetical protein